MRVQLTFFYLCLAFFVACSNTDPVQNSKNASMPNAIKEVVIYQLKSDKVASYPQIIPLVNTFLAKQKGFISRDILQDHKDPTIFVDVVVWATIADAQNAMQASQQEASILPFFEATEKVISFSHYQQFQ